MTIGIMNKKEALNVLNANIKQADEFCNYNEVSIGDKQYLDAIKIARDVLESVIKFQDAFIRE